jgi:hypothetical protein
MTTSRITFSNGASIQVSDDDGSGPLRGPADINPSKPHSARVAFLLRQRQGIGEDLAGATPGPEADGYRADLVTNAHSLWLAGYVGPATDMEG